MPTCHKCEQQFSAHGGGHCSACCRTFTGDRAFDAHRRGPYTARHCLDVTTLDGWRDTPKGWSNRPERPLATVPEREDSQ